MHAQVVCGNDSVVVTTEYTNDDEDRSYRITVATYDLDSGIVVTCEQQGIPWNPVNCQTGYWSRVDTVLDGSGRVAELTTVTGSANGWLNDRRVQRVYDPVHGTLTFEARLVWNGSAWDSVGVTEQALDGDGQVVSSAVFDFAGGVRQPLSRTLSTYIDGHPNDRTWQHGVAGTWVNDSLYQFSYSGTVRTGLAYSTWDSLAANWQFQALVPYQLQTGEWCANRWRYDPAVASGVQTIDSIRWYVDTLERVVYYHSFHWLDFNLSGSFYPTAYIKDFDHQTVASGAVLLFHSVESDYYLDVSTGDSVWAGVDRPVDKDYTYDPNDRLLTLSYTGGCTNPCGGGSSYVYEGDGFISDQHDSRWTMVRQYDLYLQSYRLPRNTPALVVPAWETDVPFCFNSTYQPNFSIAGGCGPYQVQWSPADGLSSDTVLNPVITVRGYQPYTIVLTDANGTQDTLLYSVNTPIRCTVTGSADVCDTSRTLSVPYDPDFTYAWYRDGQPMVGADSASLRVDSAGAYHVIVSGSVSSDHYAAVYCESSSDTFLIIPHAPLQAAAGATVMVCAGDTVLLGGQPAGSGGIGMLAYAWSPGVSLDNDSIEHPLAFPQASGQYVLTVTDSLGCVAQDSVWLEVPVVPVPDIQQLGDSLYTTTTAAGYQWYRNDTLIAGATDAYLLPTTSGTYQLSVTDTNGCSARSVDFVFVPTGLGSVAAVEGAMLYPNPADASVQLRLDRPAMTGVVRVFDLSGRLCYERSFEGVQAVLDVRSLAPGSYRVQVTADGMQLVSRMVVSR